MRYHSNLTLKLVFVCLVTMAASISTRAAAEARLIDLYYDYYATQTVDPAYNPANDPDMDGDGTPDLSGQSNIDTALNVLSNPGHPEHDALFTTFILNETLASSALESRFPNQPIVASLSELWALYMTIQGEGAYQGPTRIGMAGRVEVLWIGLGADSVAGAFEEQGWQQAALFGGTGEREANIVVTGDGVVVRGQRVVMTVSIPDGLSYAWYRDGAPLTTLTNPNMVIDPVDFSDAGTYHCVVEVPDKAYVQTPDVVLTVNAEPSVPTLSTWGAISMFVLLGLQAVQFQRTRR